jgi:hypothetical protein
MNQIRGESFLPGSLASPWEKLQRTGLCPEIPQRLNIELEMWTAQSKEMFQEAKTPHEKIAAVAFSHCRFERIHPFRDGNGRTGRAIINSELTAEFGANPSRALFARETYIIPNEPISCARRIAVFASPGKGIRALSVGSCH